MLLVSSQSRLPRRGQRRLIGILAGVLAMYFIMPFLQPAVFQGQLSRIETRLGVDGICLQTTWYTCGPAAAVTVLRRMGLPAEERDLALLSRTTPSAGTQPDSLCFAIRRRYASAGVSCEQRTFTRVSDLRGLGYVIAQVKFSFMVDHYVAVLDVSDTHVEVADPLAGQMRLTHDEFERIWRRTGLLIGRAV